eukprot:903475-Pleurochrysis_carterae.AAC.3
MDAWDRKSARGGRRGRGRMEGEGTSNGRARGGGTETETATDRDGSTDEWAVGQIFGQTNGLTDTIERRVAFTALIRIVVGLVVRFLLEEGKLNPCLRLMIEYKAAKEVWPLAPVTVCDACLVRSRIPFSKGSGRCSESSSASSCLR